MLIRTVEEQNRTNQEVLIVFEPNANDRILQIVLEPFRPLLYSKRCLAYLV